MAIIKIKYTRSRSAINAHIRYITHRRGRDEERITRQLLSADGAIGKLTAYQMIATARRGTIFYKIVISPDPKREDTKRDLDLWRLTQGTMLRLGESLNRELRYIAVEHNDHAPHRHVHAIVLIQGRLSREDFQALRQTARASATEEALIQRKARDLLLQGSRYPVLRSSLRTARRETGARPSRVQPGCRFCGFGELTGLPSFLRHCPLCYARLKKDQAISLGREAKV